ncbi:hypothetical protein P1J78_14665 [Psychromarinibacter sp. C21-152]|uniref:Uncharacterized protein n=1 Tax=Psychromarinibacter sediminicola TaxID=3033385 RepID=A0AAE3NT81_9RHOB|nr:hypothetical protein [Psychromarinibacter sediminicola]MDF0601984.1 hypothetical protein [Psychromarinibacter sediminicola]
MIRLSPSLALGLALTLALLATPLAAQEVDETAPAIAAVLDEARAECAAEAAAGGPKPRLEMETGAMTWTDLDGDGPPNDLVIDFNRIMCSATYSLWHGSGGSRLVFVLNGEIARTWTGGTWRVTEYGGQPLILIGRHGTYCDSYGARGCVQAILADGAGFSTVIAGARPLEEGG